MRESKKTQGRGKESKDCVQRPRGSVWPPGAPEGGQDFRGKGERPRSEPARQGLGSVRGVSAPPPRPFVGPPGPGRAQVPSLTPFLAGLQGLPGEQESQRVRLRGGDYNTRS